MQIHAGDFGVFITTDMNVMNYATDDYMSSDLTGYNPSNLYVKELRAIYNAAQNLFYRLRAQRNEVEHCKAERERLANQYAKYKALFLAACEGKQFKANKRKDTYTIGGI